MSCSVCRLVLMLGVGLVKEKGKRQTSWGRRSSLFSLLFFFHEGRGPELASSVYSGTDSKGHLALARFFVSFC